MSPETLPPASSAVPETVLWSGHTSQWVHFWYYFFCVLLAAGIVVGATLVALPTGVGALAYLALLLPLVMWLARWWLTKSTHYELTTQRLRMKSGILNRRVDELELFRVKDYSMEQPLMLRMVGLGNLTLVTADATTPTVAIRAVPGVESVRELLRNAVQNERDRKRVRQMDIDHVEEGGALA